MYICLSRFIEILSNMETKLSGFRFLMAHTTHWNTHVHIWRRHRTHTHAGKPEVAVNLFSAFLPSWTVLPPGPSRSSGQLLSARGPSEPSASVMDGQESELFFFACFSVGVLLHAFQETPCEHGENMQTP